MSRPSRCASAWSARRSGVGLARGRRDALADGDASAGLRRRPRARGEAARSSRAARDARLRRLPPPPRRRAAHRSSTSFPPRNGTSARRTTSTACDSTATSRCARSSRTPRHEQLDRPGRGEGVHEVAVGPIHAGVIESGHFRFHVVGERILHLDLRLFYKHRGLERAAEGQELPTASPTPSGPAGPARSPTRSPTRTPARASSALRPRGSCAACARSCWSSSGSTTTSTTSPRSAPGSASRPGNMAFAALKERALRLNAALAGHRFLFGAVAVGAQSTSSSPRRACDRARAELARAARRRGRGWRELAVRRLGPGPARRRRHPRRERRRRLGAVGPAARASGVAATPAAHSPRLWYGRLRPAVARRAGGDVAARLEVRAARAGQIFEMLDDLLAAPVCADRREPRRARRSRSASARVESPRGETVCVVEPERRPRRARCTCAPAPTPTGRRSPTPTAGNLLPDFPLINKSFELCYACVDR